MIRANDDIYRIEKELFDECREEIDICDDFFEKQKCVYCGYEILEDESCLKVNDTGDVIHRKCWNDYADDNISELCEEL